MSVSLDYGAQQLINAIQSGRISNSCGLAASTVVLYDHLSTLSREHQFVWGRKLDAVTLLFHLNRWIIFTWAVMNMLYVFLNFKTLQSCLGFVYSFYIVELVLIVLWAAFSAIRVFAISQGNWSFSLAVFLLGMVPFGTNAFDFFAAWSYVVV
ncbi:hypothetical protein OBBRIDRAFT_779157, partial [Obba rivulosa]